MAIQFHNQSSEQLADEYGNLKAQIDAFGEQADAIKAELVARGVQGGEKTIQWSACVCAGAGGVKVGHWIG